MKKLRALATLPCFALACCIPPAPQPAPAPVPAPTPTSAPPPVTIQPTYENWLDAPQTAGSWTYRTEGQRTYSAFGLPGQNPVFGIGCDRAAGTIGMGRESNATSPRAMRIRTETQNRSLVGQPAQGSLTQIVAVELAPRDALLDAMALSRGRFAVETEGEPTLYLPAWAEVTRVIEDCR